LDFERPREEDFVRLLDLDFERPREDDFDRLRDGDRPRERPRDAVFGFDLGALLALRPPPLPN